VINQVQLHETKLLLIDEYFDNVTPIEQQSALIGTLIFTERLAQSYQDVKEQLWKHIILRRHSQRPMTHKG